MDSLDNNNEQPEIPEPVAAGVDDVEEEEAMVGPGPAPQIRRKRPLQFEQAYLDSLPSANMYASFLVLRAFRVYFCPFYTLNSMCCFFRIFKLCW